MGADGGRELVPLVFISSPSRIAKAAVELAESGGLWNDLRVSGIEFFVGYALSVAVGIPLGIATGWYRRLSYLLDPYISALYATPRVALLPLIIIWVGIGIWSKIVVVFLGAVFPILMNTLAAVRTTDERLLRAARSFGADDFQPRTGRRLTALEGISLEVMAGEFVSVIGPSGCGKTTFLNIVDGLLTPTGGQVFLDGQPIAGPGPDRAVVFQDPCLLPWRTVARNVTYGLQLQGRLTPETAGRARRFVEMVGLQGFEGYYPHELSGGMQQRVNLARALTIDPQILLMDEPFAALDAQTREVMQQELLTIWQQARKTVLFVTHQINEAIYLSDRVVIFSARPSRVKEVLRVDLPRPRPLALKRQPRFLELEDAAWKVIEEEVRESMRADRVARPHDQE